MNIRVTTYSLVQATAGICLKKGEQREREREREFSLSSFFSEGQENLPFCFFFLVLSFRKISHINHGMMFCIVNSEPFPTFFLFIYNFFLSFFY